jgi:hypothetical protein
MLMTRCATFFRGGERILPRSPAIIGREVQKCPPPTDLILSFGEHPGVAELLPDMVQMTGARAVVAAVDNETWLPLKRIQYTVPGQRSD